MQRHPHRHPALTQRRRFNGMLQQNMPLSPQQVSAFLRQAIDLSQRASAIRQTCHPSLFSTTLMINLAPGTTPPAIRLAQGYVTSFVFVDSAGSPWPIVAGYDLGDPKANNIQSDGKGNFFWFKRSLPMAIAILSFDWLGCPAPISLS